MQYNNKKLNSIVWLLCITMLLQAFTACRSEVTKNNNTQQHTTNATLSTPNEDIQNSPPITGVGAHLGEYRVVRTSATAAPESVQATNRLVQALSDAWGKNVSAVQDVKVPDNGEKEILVGLTNRTESTEAISKLQKNEYSISVVGNKIVIAGENGLALDQGVQYFIKNCVLGASSVSEIKNYRAKYADTPIDLPDMVEGAYGDTTCLYAGCLIQDIAVDFATGDFYYFLWDQFCSTDSVVVRRTPEGHQEYMIVSGFGHFESCDIERVGDKLYIWAGSQSQDGTNKGVSTAISRFEFQAGVRVETKAGDTFMLHGIDTGVLGPCVDIANGYLATWGDSVDIYDLESVKVGGRTQISSFNMKFPFEGYELVMYGGFDLLGSYVYACCLGILNGEHIYYVLCYDLHGELVTWTTIEYKPVGYDEYYELNGIKAEMVNGKPVVMIGLTTESAVNNRYQNTIVYFADHEMELVEPTMQGQAPMEKVYHNKLPKNAKETAWTEQDGVLSINAVGDQRLMFDEAVWGKRAYTYETTLTIQDATFAGMYLAGAANVSNNSALYSRNKYIGLKVYISRTGTLTVIADGISKIYNIESADAYRLKVQVSASGEVTVVVNDAKVGVVQLNSNYVGGHVGVYVQSGTASFVDTVLTYHHI